MTHSVEPSGPKLALDAFLAAAERGDYEACWRLLASPLRERYTPARLGEDFAAVRGSAQDKLARARLASAVAPKVEEGRAEFPVSERASVKLTHEADGWKIASLE
ncbi:MAG: hypothetical protein HY901_01875 [Deltaproteobacteria bacterium]|nr:hypothetical protein [Deltaproteobacteria bacterium]